MTDLRALTDAFAELERRADVASARMQPELPPHAPPRRAPRPGSRLMPVAATVAVVAGLAIGAAQLAPGDNRGTPAGAQPPAESPIAQPAPAFVIPATPEELAARFRTVLGDTATFTVTDGGAAVVMTAPPAPGEPASEPPSEPPMSAPTSGAAISGTLTASGLTGGFDLHIYAISPGEQAWCDSPDPAGCTESRLADGSLLAVGQVPLDGSPDGITYMVSLIRPDGVMFLMHVSNERSPKGHSEVLAPRPPLSTDQMIAIVTSDRW